MKEIKVKASKDCSIYITSGSSSLVPLLETHKVKKCFIVTDENVYELYKNYIDLLSDRILGIKIIKPGEASKNINVISEIYSELVKCGADKKTTIISLGGGVVGDISGFAASTYMRGMNLVHIPTTLMSQCDSSIGGKNGFNFKDIKNLIGSFYPPVFVYTDANFIKSLNMKEYKNGMSEIIKYGFACDEGLFHYIEENRKGILEREVDRILHLVYECARIKGRIVEKDEYDTGERHILNFGHTIGHAIESAADFEISHGEAVAAGMNAAARIAVKIGYINEESYKRLLNILAYFKLPIEVKGISKKR